MRQKHIPRLGIVTAFAVAIVLAATTGGFAGEQDEKPGMPHAGMAKPMMDEGMMAMHQKMHAKMQAMDQKLDALVAEMVSAGGRQKADAVAAVVAELVSQRKAMHGMMMEMQPRMMGHMMEHMRSGMMSGMMEGMQQSMADCPMMKQMTATEGQAEEEDHSAHHPEG